MISTFTNKEEKRNFMKIFLFLSNEYQLSSPSLLLAIYGINYCQTNLYVCLLESTPLFHFSSFYVFSGFHFHAYIYVMYWWKLSSLYQECYTNLEVHVVYPLWGKIIFIPFEAILDRKLEMIFDTFYSKLIISNKTAWFSEI